MTEIRTRLKRGHVIRQVIIAIVCIVLGLWGVYDYIWTIPYQQESHDRYLICQSVVDVLESEPGSEGFTEKVDTAKSRITTEMEGLLSDAWQERASKDAVPPATQQEALDQRVEELKKTIETLGQQGEEKWFKTLALFHQAVTTPRPPATGQAKLTGMHEAAWDVATAGVNYFAEVTPPGAYDRVMKGLVFIPCLPVGLYLLFALYLQSRKTYRLDASGDLHLPGGATWKSHEIQDIDMNRWMAKSVARVKHTSGAEAKLDDYIYQDTHLLVGALAHRFHPQDWTEDARPVKAEQPESADEAGEPPAHDEVPVAATSEQPARSQS